MKVKNMQSSNGNSVPNQFIIEDAFIRFPKTSPDGKNTIIQEWGGTAFRSYNSNIVFKEDTGRIYLDKRYWDYSVTTGKYRNQFLGETKKETQAKIKSGEYILTNLN